MTRGFVASASGLSAWPRSRATALTLSLPIAAATAVAAGLGSIAADARWLAVVGAYITKTGSIPSRIPYASATSSHWHDVPVLAELVFHGLDVVGGARALLIAQVVAVAIAFALLQLDMRKAGASDAGVVIALLVLIPATFSTLALVRVQLFSLVLFPLVVLLLRAQHRAPSARIWFVPPLLALWANLHGLVLLGLLAATAYLILERAREHRWEAAGVLAASLLATCATPALAHTPAYFARVATSEAARRGVGLWAHLSLHSAPDVVLIVGLALLAAAATRARVPVWELVVIIAFAILTVRAARTGAWLAYFVATPAAVGLARERSLKLGVVFGFVSLGLAALTVAALVRGPHESGASRTVLAAALAQSRGTPILASDLLAEQVALAGGRVWMSNPIDAFTRHAQRVYVAWLQGRPSGRAALAEAPRVVLAAPRTPAARLTARSGAFREIQRDQHAVLYLRRA